MRIYVIEDEPMIQIALSRLLRPLRGELRMFTEPLSAIRSASTEEVHLVVTDYTLPGCNGVDAISQIRQLHPKAKTVLITADLMRDNIKAALATGLIDRFVAKPWDMSAFQKLINEVVASPPASSTNP